MEEPNPVVIQMHAQLTRSTTRLARLEADAEKEDVLIMQSQAGQESFKASIDEQFDKIASSLTGIAADIKLLQHKASRIVNDFRELVKNEQLQLLRTRADNWQLETFITKDEFERLLTERFSGLQ